MRYVVRSLEGYLVNPLRGHSAYRGNSRPGLTIWVADELMGGKEVKRWRSEERHANSREEKFRRMFAEAQALADSLNAASLEAPA